MDFTFAQVFLSILVNGYPLCRYALKYDFGKSLSFYLEKITVAFYVLKMLVLLCTDVGR